MDTMDNMLSNLKLISEDIQSISDFCPKLEFLQKSMETSKFNKNKGAVTLSTMHSSKGLEFDSVYIIDMIDGIIPSYDSIKSSEEGDTYTLEEETRLLYVSMTRSRKNLYLMYPASKNGVNLLPSRFLKKIDNILYSLRPKTSVLPSAGNRHAAGFKINMIVEHKSFGKGEIINITGDNLKILFESGTTRLLSANVCNVNGILKVTHW
jgi:DNA helicase II / ATP-dependent DNA helicase PcrA